jgi:hypothetical protein
MGSPTLAPQKLLLTELPDVKLGAEQKHTFNSRVMQPDEPTKLFESVVIEAPFKVNTGDCWASAGRRPRVSTGLGLTGPYA